MNWAHSIPRQLLAVGVVVLLVALPVALYAQAESRPRAPKLTSSVAERSVRLNWNPDLPPETSATWEVWVWTEQSGWTRLDDGNRTSANFTHTGLELGVKYWYTYRANYIGGGQSQFSHYSNIMLSDEPASFVAPNVTAQAVGNAINVTWTEVPGVSHYKVACWCGSGSWDAVDVRDVREKTYQVSSSPHTYYFSVQAVNGVGDTTAWSEFASVTTPIATATPTPALAVWATSTPQPTPTPSAVPTKDYSTLLFGITIAPERHCTRLEYSQYGFSHRSAAAATLRAQIVHSMGGRYYDPYLGRYFGGDDDMRINHIVEIDEAHISGMCHESRQPVRHTFVYDSENAVMTSHRLTGHSAADLHGWLPDFNRCWYVNQVVHVKRKYGLTMDQDEADTAVEVLSGCSSTAFVFSDSPTPTPTIVTNDPLQMYDDDGNEQISCEEARRHGIAPVHSVHPAYPYMSDPDGNGIACE